MTRIRFHLHSGCETLSGETTGEVYAYVTSDVDTWGKRAILVAYGNAPDAEDFERWWLFDDEYEVVA